MQFTCRQYHAAWRIPPSAAARGCGVNLPETRVALSNPAGALELTRRHAFFCDALSVTPGGPVSAARAAVTCGKQRPVLCASVGLRARYRLWSCCRGLGRLSLPEGAGSGATRHGSAAPLRAAPSAPGAYLAQAVARGRLRCERQLMRHHCDTPLREDKLPCRSWGKHLAHSYCRRPAAPTGSSTCCWLRREVVAMALATCIFAGGAESQLYQHGRRASLGRAGAAMRAKQAAVTSAPARGAAFYDASPCLARW